MTHNGIAHSHFTRIPVNEKDNSSLLRGYYIK